MEEVSRRSFLKGSALAAAGVAGATALAGCAGNDAALSDTGSTPEWMPETWDYETDVLVIGYGGAGLWAGITAYDEGAQVLYLEKSPFRGGGSSSINMGQWTAPHDADAAAQFAFEAFHGQTPMEVCQAWADEAVQNPDYADEYGLEYSLGDSPRAEYDIFTGYEEMYVGQGDGYGAGFFEAMDQHRQDRGIEVLFECHDEELIQNPVTKEIIGCYTLMGDDAKPKAVKASKGVILCTGGFEFNEELQAKYLKCYPMRGFYGWKYNTGDGITMAQKVGADLWHMQQVCGGDDAWFDDPEIVPGGPWAALPPTTSRSRAWATAGATRRSSAPMAAGSPTLTSMRKSATSTAFLPGTSSTRPPSTAALGAAWSAAPPPRTAAWASAT